MMLNDPGSKLKSKWQSKPARTAVLAAVLAVLIHGVVFSIPAYLIYRASKSEIRSSKSEIRNSTILVDLAVLPAIRTSGQESVIKENSGKKPAAQEPGPNGQAAKQGSTDAEKEMLTYQDIIKQKIQQARKYPADARQKGIEGNVQLAFTIIKQGTLKNAEITGTSGNASLDEEAIATVKRASPFPEIPAIYAGGEMTMKVKLIFNIE